MNAIQSSKLTMYLTVQDVLADHQPVWTSLAGFAAGAEELDDAVASILAQAQIQTSRTGAGAEKAAALQSLADTAYEVAGAVRACAVATGNKDLAGRVAFARSDIAKGRDHSVVARCQDILAAATENLNSLAGYGVTAAKLTTLKKKVEGFQALIPKPRSGRVTSRSATQELPKLFKQADELLSERLDKLAVQFKATQPAFYNAYTSARSIVGPGYRSAKEPAPAAAVNTDLPKAA